jgi:hypothetical protein
MNQQASKSSYYDPFASQQRTEVPVHGTLTLGRLHAGGAIVSSETGEAWNQLAVAIARTLDTVADAFSRKLLLEAQTSVITTHIQTYDALVKAEQAKAAGGGCLDSSVSDHYWEHCLARSVKETCRKPCEHS